MHISDTYVYTCLGQRLFTRTWAGKADREFSWHCSGMNTRLPKYYWILTTPPQNKYILLFSKIVTIYLGYYYGRWKGILYVLLTPAPPYLRDDAADHYLGIYTSICFRFEVCCCCSLARVSWNPITFVLGALSQQPQKQMNSRLPDMLLMKDAK